MHSSRFSVFERSCVFSFVLVQDIRGRPHIGRILSASCTYGVTEDDRPYCRFSVTRGWAQREYAGMLSGPAFGANLMDITLSESGQRWCGGLAKCRRGSTAGCGHDGCGGAVFSEFGRPAFAVSALSVLVARTVFSLSNGGPSPAEARVRVEVDCFGWRSVLPVLVEDIENVVEDSCFDRAVLAVAWPWNRTCCFAACHEHMPPPVVVPARFTACYGPGGVRYVVGDPSDDPDEEMELVVAGDEVLPGPPPGTPHPRDDSPAHPCEDEGAELDAVEHDLTLPLEKALEGGGVPVAGDGGLAGGDGRSATVAWAAAVGRHAEGRGGRDDVRLWRVAAGEGVFGLVEGLRILGLSRGDSSGCRFGWLTPEQAGHVLARLRELAGNDAVDVPLECCSLLLSPRWFGVLRVLFPVIGDAVGGGCSSWGPWLVAGLSSLGSDHERATALVTLLGCAVPFLALPCPRPLMRTVEKDWRHLFDVFFPWILPRGLTAPKFSNGCPLAADDSDG